MADPLKTLLRLRRLEVDEARLALAEGIREERAVHAAVAIAQHAREREMREASDMPLQNRGPDEFVAWLGAHRAHRAVLEIRQTAVAVRTEEARAALAASRSAAEAVEELLLQQRGRHLAERARLEQLTLDEAAARLTR